jgi:NAD(P)-dependent dehydrogenase (short-subunit alcohol dehydrogenase family)
MSNISSQVCDVADEAAVVALRDAMDAAGGTDMLVNNAGIMHAFDVTQGFPLEKQLQEIDIDVSGPVRLGSLLFARDAETRVGHCQRQLRLSLRSLCLGPSLQRKQSIFALVHSKPAISTGEYFCSGGGAVAAGGRYSIGG